MGVWLWGADTSGGVVEPMVAGGELQAAFGRLVPREKLNLGLKE